MHTPTRATRAHAHSREQNGPPAAPGRPHKDGGPGRREPERGPGRGRGRAGRSHDTAVTKQRQAGRADHQDSGCCVPTRSGRPGGPVLQAVIRGLSTDPSPPTSNSAGSGDEGSCQPPAPAVPGHADRSAALKAVALTGSCWGPSLSLWGPCGHGASLKPQADLHTRLVACPSCSSTVRQLPASCGEDQPLVERGDQARACPAGGQLPREVPDSQPRPCACSQGPPQPKAEQESDTGL